MAYDREIVTPRGRIGLNVEYLESTLKDTVIKAFFQQPDGTWVYKGFVAVGGVSNISGTPAVILANILEDEDVLATPVSPIQAETWLVGQTKDAAQMVIIRWIVKNLSWALLTLLNKIIGVAGQTPPPATTDPNAGPFVSAEHAIRTAVKSLDFKVNPTTSEITL